MGEVNVPRRPVAWGVPSGPIDHLDGSMTDETSELQLSIADTGAEVRVEVGGELDLRTCDVFLTQLDDLIEIGTGDVALDLSAVSFCDSTALQALIETRRRLLVMGRRLRVVQPSRPVDRVLWLSGLAEVFYLPAAASDV